MTKPSTSRLALLFAAIGMGLAAVALLAKALARGTSPAIGIIMISLSVIMLVIGIARKPANPK